MSATQASFSIGIRIGLLMGVIGGALCGWFAAEEFYAERIAVLKLQLRYSQTEAPRP